jgi:bifunctional DNase/RNase
MLPVDLTGIALDINSGAPMVVLQERDEPRRVLPIFVGPPEATAIAIAAAGQRAPQPLVHDVMTALVAALDGHVDAVEVNDLREGVFTASISLSGPTGQRRVGSRPSDALALAVRTGAPVFVDEAVLDAAGHLPQEIEPVESDADAIPQLDEATIDTEVESFRSFLDDIDPADFASSSADPELDTDDGSPESD